MIKTFHVELVSTPLKLPPSNPPSFTFTSNEILVVRQIWDRLDITVHKPAKVKPERKTTVVERRASVSERKKPVERIEKPEKVEITVRNSAKLRQFQYTLCGIISTLETSKSTAIDTILGESSDINDLELRLVKSSYQIDTIIQLLTLTISSLSGFSDAINSIIMKLIKINSRVWDIGQRQLSLVGESLILTLTEILGRKFFNPEMEVVWIKFYNKLSNLILYHCRDPVFDLPIINTGCARQADPMYNPHTIKAKPQTHSRAMSVTSVDTINPAFESCSLSHRTSYGDDSTKSVLSLHQNDDTSSISTIEQSPRKSHEKDLDDTMNNIEEESHSSSTDDDCFDLLNSFETTVKKQKLMKKSRSERSLNSHLKNSPVKSRLLKRQSMDFGLSRQLTLSSQPTRLSKIITNNQSDMKRSKGECTIM